MGFELHIPLLLLILFVDGIDDAYCAAHDWAAGCNAFVAGVGGYGANGGAYMDVGNGWNAMSCKNRYTKSQHLSMQIDTLFSNVFNTLSIGN